MPQEKLDPSALTPKQLAELLAKSSKRAILPRHIERDISDGAPTNGDRSVNLIHYAAWLAARSMD